MRLTAIMMLMMKLINRYCNNYLSLLHNRNGEKKEVSWKFDVISMESEGKGLGSLKAKFDVDDGPSTPGPVNVHFSGNEATFSGVEFQLNCIGYRISLMKKQISTGK